MAIRGILWDFGNTLADQDWMLRPSPALPGWEEAWIEIARGPNEEAWYRGGLTSEEIAAQVAGRLGASAETVLTHMEECCRHISYFPVSLSTAELCPLPRAIVTVNPDLFSRWVVPHGSLADVFSTIVTSWEEEMNDKGTLCRRAIERWEGPREPSEVLLIDNSEEALESWARHGGPGYHYRGGQVLESDLGGELRELLVTP